MNDAALRKLEFGAIRELLATHCASSLGKQLALRISPSTSSRQVTVWLDQVRELLAIREDFGLPPMGGVRDIRQHVRDAAQPAGLEPEALVDVAQTMAGTGLVREWLATVAERAPMLSRFNERIADYSVPARTISDSIDSRGQVMDSASPRLANIRSTETKLRNQISDVFARLLRQSRVVRMLQYPSTTFHNDRTVLPLKAEHRGRVPGIVHRSSDSGATLFVEPAEAVELNNSIVRLRTEEHKEITRILSVLSRLVHDNEAGLLQAVDAMAVLDVAAAKCRYAVAREAVCPDVREDGVLYLHDARHPLLMELFAREAEESPGAARQVVPIDVRLGDDFDLLAITGPNTGGKTVALKTVGLLTMMAQAGMPIPAGTGSEIPVYRKIFVDIGDEQSIEQSLSTFSAHMTNILEILRQAGPGSLVLIDELGAGTDPDEGAAIGRTVMEELLAKGAKVMVTTHLSALKAMAFTNPRTDNASVEFDVESLRPTYHLRLGEPGNSNAIVVAQRLGMPPHLTEQARRHLADSHHQLQEAIEGTLESRRLAESARRKALAAKINADRSRVEFEEQARRLSEQQDQYAEWVSWINRLAPGDQVYVKKFEKNARVVRMALHQQSVLVSAGAMDIEVGISEVSRPQAGL